MRFTEMSLCSQELIFIGYVLFSVWLSLKSSYSFAGMGKYADRWSAFIQNWVPILISVALPYYWKTNCQSTHDVSSMGWSGCEWSCVIIGKDLVLDRRSIINAVLVTDYYEWTLFLKSRYKSIIQLLFNPDFNAY